MMSAGTLIIDTPNVSKLYVGVDVPLPAIARGYVQMRRYSPRAGTGQAFQVCNVYFKSGREFDFNTKLIEALCLINNDIATFLCGDTNFIEFNSDISSTTPLLAPANFLTAWEKLKSHFNLYEPPNEAHTFYHLTSDPSSPFSWSSRIDRLLVPAILADHPAITPVVSIPSHHTNLSVSNQSGPRFSDHLPLHVSFVGDNPNNSKPRIPHWLAASPEFAEALRNIWKERPPPKKRGYTCLAAFKRALFQAAKTTRGKKLEALTAPLSLSQHLSLLRQIQARNQDTQRINHIITLNPLLATLVTCDNGHWNDNGLLAATLNLRAAALPSPGPPSHFAKSLVEKVPSSRTKIGPLKSNADDQEAITDHDRANVAANFWSKIWAERSCSPRPQDIDFFLASYTKKIKTTLCRLPTIENIIATIKHSNNSAPGPDGISFAAWKAAPELAAPVLWSVLHALSKGQPPPPGFNDGILFLLPKKHTTLISDTRPLSVTNTDNRILAAAVANAAMPAILDIIDPAQKGFLNGRSGADHIVDINTFFYEGVEKGIDRHLFLLDTAKAFDSIDHAWIFIVLKHLGFPPWFCLFVKGALSSVRVSPYFGQETNVWINIERRKAGLLTLSSSLYHCL
jgi:hypothetical protein